MIKKEKGDIFRCRRFFIAEANLPEDATATCSAVVALLEALLVCLPILLLIEVLISISLLVSAIGVVVARAVGHALTACAGRLSVIHAILEPNGCRGISVCAVAVVVAVISVTV